VSREQEGAFVNAYFVETAAGVIGPMFGEERPSRRIFLPRRSATARA
jgi:hypothetical protein